MLGLGIDIIHVQKAITVTQRTRPKKPIKSIYIRFRSFFKKIYYSLSTRKSFDNCPFISVKLIK